jgi:hypothetical protein
VQRGSVGCGVAQQGAEWLSRVRRGSAGCGMALQGAAWLSRVRCCSVGCGVAQKGGFLAQLMAHHHGCHQQ